MKTPLRKSSVRRSGPLRSCALLATFALAGANGRHDVDGRVIEGLAPEELAVTASGKLGDRAPSITLWKDTPVDTRGTPPYPYPADRKYNTGAGPVPGKINVHLVPHSHDDTGWQVTVDQYFASEVYYIIDTVVQNLAVDHNRRFIYVETGFFARWWEQASEEKRSLAKEEVQRGQLEFINGGWCMHDEASPLWTAMVDQTTRGHQFILKNFGPDAAPRGTWQIDPFGHTNTEAWLLGAEAGFESLYWGRMDWQDRQMRYEKRQGTNGFEWIWQGSESLGSSAQIFAGNLFGHGGGGYSTWMSFDGGGDDQVNDDPARHDYNVDQWVDKFVQDALDQANHTLSDHQMWACGTDFQYQNADRWYRNLDKLIHYVNLNGTVNAFYSTPSLYTDEKKKWSGSYEVRTDDIMPLADNAHNYWSGYFTSRPSLKRQVRFATNLLFAARQLEVITNTTAAEVGMPTVKRSPPVGAAATDSLEGTVGVATHHDGMSGTERQSVTDDYSQRISESSFEVEGAVAVALSKLLGTSPAQIQHCNCNVEGNCLNMSVCAATTGPHSFTVAAWNPLAHGVSTVGRLPVASLSGSDWAVTDSTGKTLPSQLVPIDNRTHSLPLMYLNSHGLSKRQAAAASAALANKATHELFFTMALPPVGLATFAATRTPPPPALAAARALRAEESAEVAEVVQEVVQEVVAEVVAEVVQASEAEGRGGVTVQNEAYSLTFDDDTGLLSSITNRRSGASTPLSVSWGWYNSSVGGCTSYGPDVPAAIRSPPCTDQKSGAYIFRPNSSTLFFPGPPAKPTVQVVRGPVVTEVHQRFSTWASHVIRLHANMPYVEVEWTAGPIPVDTPWLPPVAFAQGEAGPVPLPNHWGKEVVVKYSSGLASKGEWYTDSNGKELVHRKLNARGPSYPHPYNISEPVAGNYYPVNAMMALNDGQHELAVLTDVSQGGASLQDGELEYMVHRRLQDDDSRGVQEPLNETMCGCNDIGAAPGKMGAHGHEGDGGCECAGLTVRGRHWLLFDEVDKVHELRRSLSEQLNFPPTLAFTSSPPVPSFSSVSAALPANVKLVTLTNNYEAIHGGQLLLRLSHLYAAGEHPTLGQPVTLNLQTVFGKAGLRIVAATETTLTANRHKDDTQTAHPSLAPAPPAAAWRTHAANGAVAKQQQAIADKAFERRTPFAFPTLTIRPMEVRTFLATFA